MLGVGIRRAQPATERRSAAAADRRTAGRHDRASHCRCGRHVRARCMGGPDLRRRPRPGRHVGAPPAVRLGRRDPPRGIGAGRREAPGGAVAATADAGRPRRDGRSSRRSRTRSSWPTQRADRDARADPCARAPGRDGRGSGVPGAARGHRHAAARPVRARRPGRPRRRAAAIAVVGTRRATNAGRATAARIATNLVSAGRHRGLRAGHGHRRRRPRRDDPRRRRHGRRHRFGSRPAPSADPRAPGGVDRAVRAARSCPSSHRTSARPTARSRAGTG